jgi:hypothetical protein
MKLLFLTAAAVIAMPVAAQTTTSDPMTQDQTMDQTTTDSSTTAQTTTMSDPTPAQDPPGGYMPPAPPLSGPVTPETNVIFQPSAPPSQVFPAPPPMAEYPICEPGQFDNCRQRGG